MADRCPTCDRPRATEEQWCTVREGERADLCWGDGIDCRANAVDWRARAQRAEAAIEAFATTVDDAARHHESRGRGGQHVPFTGDFASMPPSSMVRLKWWVRHLKESKNG